VNNDIAQLIALVKEHYQNNIQLLYAMQHELNERVDNLALTLNGTQHMNEQELQAIQIALNNIALSSEANTNSI
jgi:hypothetical protein